MPAHNSPLNILHLHSMFIITDELLLIKYQLKSIVYTRVYVLCSSVLWLLISVQYHTCNTMISVTVSHRISSLFSKCPVHLFVPFSHLSSPAVIPGNHSSSCHLYSVAFANTVHCSKLLCFLAKNHALDLYYSFHFHH